MSGIWTLDGGVIRRVANCVNPLCKERVVGERAEHSLSYLQPRASSEAQGWKRRHLCGACLQRAFETAPEVLPLEGPSTRSAEYLFEVFVPKAPWDGYQNAHGAFWDGAFYPYWGTARQGVYWRKRLANLKRTGTFGSLQKMGYDSIVRCEVAYAGGVEKLEWRFTTQADLLRRIHEAEESLGLIKNW